MRTISVSELHANLGRTLRDLEIGESILITESGRVVAELRRPGKPYLLTTVKAPPGTAKLVLDAEREDR